MKFPNSKEKWRGAFGERGEKQRGIRILTYMSGESTCGGKITCNFLRNDSDVKGDGGEEEEEDEEGDGKEDRREKKYKATEQGKDGEEKESEMEGNEDEDPLFMYEEITTYLISLQPQIQPQRESTENDVIEAKLPLRSSLFYHVSPYLEFQLHSPINVPEELTNCLKWKLTPTTPRIVRSIARNTGYAMTEDPSDWCGCWCDSMFAFRFKHVKNHQKVNHFPGSYEIGHKDRLCRNLNRLADTRGRKRIDFIPDTYIVPEDLPKIRASWCKRKRNKWIVKPPASSQGRGIFLTAEFAKIPRLIADSGKMIVQHYLSRPKLINGTKFDLRIYVLVTSFDPLRIYVYREGLVRFACDRYRNSASNLNNHFMHLTNYSVNRFCSRYECNDTLGARKGHKWSLGCLWSYLSNQGVDTMWVLKKIYDLIVKTIVSCESTINSFTRVYLSSTYSCYELFGFDVLLDENMKPWLLEVNTSPSLHTSSALDEAVKGPLIRDTFNMVGYQVPSALSPDPSDEKYELDASSSLFQDHRFHDKELGLTAKRKRTVYSYKCYRDDDNYIDTILDSLTPDEVRHLMKYEDEIQSIGNFSKIFPTIDSRRYFKYFDRVSYYNLLFDAWERTYGSDNGRQMGIARLRNFSEGKYHLLRL